MNRIFMARSATCVGPSIGKVCNMGGEGVVWSEMNSFLKCQYVECVHTRSGGAKNKRMRLVLAGRFQYSSGKESGGLPTKEYFGVTSNDMMPTTYKSPVFVKGNISLFLGVCYMTPHLK